MTPPIATRSGIALTAMVAAGLLLGAACGDAASTAVGEPESGDAIDQARRRWAEAAITTYHYEVVWSIEPVEELSSTCAAQSPLTVEVVDGRVVTARGAAGCVIDPDDPDREPLTAEEWFDHLDATDPGDVHGLRFDDNGFPVSVTVMPDGGFIEAGIRGWSPGPLDQSVLRERRAELDAARQRWSDAGPTSYGFTIRFDCFCDPESIGSFRVEVRDGEVVELTRDGGASAGERPAEAWGGFLTVDGLFDQIERFLAGDELTVGYDPELGHPLGFRTDPDTGTYDDELNVTVSDLTPLADR